MKPVRFGIIATGRIAHKFARTMPLISPEDGILSAVASRTIEKAENFAREYSIPKAYGTYRDLLADPEIDAVYIATPHLEHKPCSLEAIGFGKHVLCEKPLATTRADAEEIFSAARNKGVFFMEAMWTRFMPTILKAKEWIKDGKIGKVKFMRAAFGYNAPYSEPLSPIYLPEHAGGAVYDVGVYCIDAALDFFEPAKVTDIKGLADISPLGVDSVGSYIIKFSNGGIASLASAISCQLENDCVIYGEKGKIKLYPEFYAPAKAELWIKEQLIETEETNTPSGFEFEIAHTIDCIRAGKVVSERMGPEVTLECCGIFEELMDQGFYHQDILIRNTKED